jgi:hypothetical protein
MERYTLVTYDEPSSGASAYMEDDKAGEWVRYEDVERALEMLESLEWVDEFACPECFRTVSSGHSVDCALSAILQNIDK